MSSGTDDTVAAKPGVATAKEPATAPSFPPVDPSFYALGDEIARGGMGRILAAHDRRLGRTVAIKELLHADAETRARFEREARITARLQHPSIVNVIEAGTWPSGEPFYVMKLVAGESLDKVIAKRETLPERLALVPDVLAVTRALAYAHGKRVIHRDLKPANVLVGEFGEIVVVDWGLAKDLDAPSTGTSIDRAAPKKTTHDPTATAVGSVMGTPAYMPSEQALGDPVDERADVYALGAMLYHVLAGQPPYLGKTTEDVLANVITGPPKPLGARVAGVPADLVAIVDKAMAHDARDRYPTAKELSDDLAKFQTGKLVGAHRYSAWQLVARWIRRHRASVAVGAIAVALLVALGVTSIVRIIRERERTEAQRRAAEDLVEFMMVDLRDKLVPLGRVDLLDGMAKRSRDYYAKPGATGDARRATALVNIGDILRLEGDLAGALAEYRLAATIMTGVPLAALYDKIGDVLLAQRDTTGALDVYRKSLALATTPHDLAVSHDKLGDVHMAREDFDAAQGEYATALSIRETGGASSQDPQRQKDLAAIYDRLGDVQAKRKDWAGALGRYLASHAIMVAIAGDDPTDKNRRDLSASFDRIGDVLVDRDDFAGALTNYRESLAIRAALAAKDPENAEWQRLHMLALDDVGDIALQTKDPARARELYEQSTAIAAKLAAKDPTNIVSQRDLAWSHMNVAEAIAAAGDTTGAREWYDRSIAIFEALDRRAPNDAVTQRAIATVRGKRDKLQ